MIYDTFEHAGNYFSKDSLLYKAIIYAKELDPEISDGRYDVQGEDMFSLVMTYETSPAEERRFEAHKKYIDVQVILSGEETIGVTLENNLDPLEKYSKENDVIFLESPKDSSVLTMKPGYFAVFFPHDIHRPNCLLREAQQTRKAVIKVKI
jgi:biofilm protein TabA